MPQTFDYMGALREGYTPKEIKRFVKGLDQQNDLEQRGTKFVQKQARQREAVNSMMESSRNRASAGLTPTSTMYPAGVTRDPIGQDIQNALLAPRVPRPTNIVRAENVAPDLVSAFELAPESALGDATSGYLSEAPDVKLRGARGIVQGIKDAPKAGWLGLNQAASAGMQAIGDVVQEDIGILTKAAKATSDLLTLNMSPTEIPADTGSNIIQRVGRDAYAAHTQGMQELADKYAPDSWGGAVMNAGAQTGQQLGILATAAAIGARNPVAMGNFALGALGAQSGLTEYGDARSKGFDVPRSMLKAGVGGGMEVATEVMPMGKLVNFMSAPAKKGVVAFLKDAAEYGLQDIGGELLNTMITDVVNNKMQARPNMTTQEQADEVSRYFSSGEWRQAAAATFKQAVLQSGMMMGAAKGVQHLDAKIRGEQDPLTDGVTFQPQNLPPVNPERQWRVDKLAGIMANESDRTAQMRLNIANQRRNQQPAPTLPAQQVAPETIQPAATTVDPVQRQADSAPIAPTAEAPVEPVVAPDPAVAAPEQAEEAIAPELADLLRRKTNLEKAIFAADGTEKKTATKRMKDNYAAVTATIAALQQQEPEQEVSADGQQAEPEAATAEPRAVATDGADGTEGAAPAAEAGMGSAEAMPGADVSGVDEQPGDRMPLLRPSDVTVLDATHDVDGHAVSFSQIPFERKEFAGEGQPLKKVSGLSRIIDYAGRKMVLANINGTQIPFYLSTGKGGKADVTSGKWYPVFGIGKDGWLNKTSGKEINDYYGSSQLKSVAEWLDSNIGDVRNESHEQVGATGPHFDAINSGLTPTENGTAATAASLRSNIDSALKRLNAPAATDQTTVTAAPADIVALVDGKTDDQIQKTIDMVRGLNPERAGQIEAYWKSKATPVPEPQTGQEPAPAAQDGRESVPPAGDATQKEDPLDSQQRETAEVTPIPAGRKERIEKMIERHGGVDKIPPAWREQWDRINAQEAEQQDNTVTPSSSVPSANQKKPFDAAAFMAEREKEQARSDAAHERAYQLETPEVQDAQAKYENGTIDIDEFEKQLDQAQAGSTKEQATFQDMVREAARWKGAALNAEAALGDDKKARLAHSRMTTKADLDAYLIRKFGVDDVTARSVSNELTAKNVPADKSAQPAEFAEETWAHTPQPQQGKIGGKLAQGDLNRILNERQERRIESLSELTDDQIAEANDFADEFFSQFDGTADDTAASTGGLREDDSAGSGRDGETSGSEEGVSAPATVAIDESGWGQQVAPELQGSKKAVSFGDKEQAGRTVGLSEFMDGFTPDPQQGLFGGTTTLDSMGLQQIYERLANTKLVKDAMADLKRLGMHVYAQGRTAWKPWFQGMKDSLGKLFRRFRPTMEKLWQTINNERGSLTLRTDRTGDPRVDAVLDKIGSPDKTLADRIKDSLGNLAHKETRMREIEQGFFDRYASLRYLDKMAGVTGPDDSAYISARMTTSFSDVMYAMVHHGHPVWKDGGSAVQGKGLMEIFAPVADELDVFMGWMVGARAQKLMNEGRERYFDQDEINILKGLKTTENSARWEKVRREYLQYKKQVLDFAEQAGVINPDARKIWDHEEYVPFYRVVDDKPKGPFKVKGLASQNSGIRTLKGADERLGDIFENIIRNFSHLVDASIKNRATELAVQKAEQIGAVTPAPLEWKAVKIGNQQVVDAVHEFFGETQDDIDAFVNPEEMEAFTTFFHPAKPMGKDVIHVLRDGKPQYYQVHDDLLLRSMTSINEQIWGGPAMTAMRAVKRFLTIGVTSAPDFMIRNFVRDTLHTWTISRGDFVPVVSSLTGAVKAFREDDDMVQLMAAGGAFHGGFAYGNDPAAVKLMVRKLITKKGIDKRTILDSPRKLWEFWHEFGGAMENAARVRTYANVKVKTGSHLQAAFEAKDVMDFSMRGDWAAINFLTQTVPFLGARIQGLQRLGKGMMENPVAFTLKGSVIALASTLLWLHNSMRPEYQELEEWDKDTYFHFFVGKKHFRLPKPFEVGAIFGTMPERLMELTLEKQHDGGLFFERMMAILTQTFAVGLPQILNEPMQQWANKDFFTGREIVGRDLQRLLPGEQSNPYTSATAKELGRAVHMSPRRIEHAVKGYFGELGMYCMGASDMLVRKLWDYPSEPATKPEDWPVLSAFYRGERPARNTKYTTEFYDLLREADQLTDTIQRLRETGEVPRADKLIEKNLPKLAVGGILGQVQSELSRINKQMKRVHLDRSMSPDEKKAQLDELQGIKNEITRGVVGQAKEAMD